ncbi:MAG: asparagine synthase (glutamine-hydrolyzing) [Vicinamibacterales bacterium]
MCGICGFAERDVRQPARLDDLKRMTTAIAHRGPDGDGLITLGPIGLGHRRLAIVDTSPAGAQPMTNADRTLWIVYNGEIYNYRDERKGLEGRGHHFRSRSDTEVLLALYQEYGEACLERLHGMFAFAIWDVRADRFFLARDRFGKKPLYYRSTAQRFAFASEIKALLADGSPTPQIQLEAINHFLSFDYVPGPRTAFQDILKLPAGHQLIYKGGQIRVSRYRPMPSTFAPAGERPSPSELRQTLTAAVQRRLMGEVPVGVFLSGGVDSSAIVALLAEAGGAPIQTFSVAFREPSHDERREARLVASRFGTNHREFKATPALADELPSIVRHFDEPFGDPSALPTYFLAREARRDITVALTGDGGDELFAGYDRYVKNALAERALRWPRWLRRTAATTLQLVVPRSLRFEHPLRQIQRFCALDPSSLETLYCRWLLHFDADHKRELYTDEFRASVHEDSCALVQAFFDQAGGRDLAAREMEVDVASYLTDDLLIKTDMATMAVGMEARCPFLDVDVAAAAAALPSSAKLHGLRTKHVLKQALAGVLPHEILERRKHGFGLPIDQWLKRELRPLVYEVLLGQRASERGYVRTDSVRRMVEEHEAGRRQWQYHLWNLLVLELWHREVIDPHQRTADSDHFSRAYPTA